MSDQIEVRVNSHGPGRALSLVYRDSITGKRVVKSSGIRDTGPKARKEAERAAAVLQDELNSGRYKPASKITFQEARERFEAEHLAGLGHGSPAGYNAALNHLERLINPDRLSKAERRNNFDNFIARV